MNQIFTSESNTALYLTDCVNIMTLIYFKRDIIVSKTTNTQKQRRTQENSNPTELDENRQRMTQTESYN